MSTSFNSTALCSLSTYTATNFPPSAPISLTSGGNVSPRLGPCARFPIALSCRNSRNSHMALYDLPSSLACQEAPCYTMRGATALILRGNHGGDDE